MRDSTDFSFRMAYIIQEFKLYAKGEHSHKLGNEQQQADQKSAADAWKIKGKVGECEEKCNFIKLSDTSWTKALR